MDSQAIGRRVRYWRSRRNLTRQQFADLCGRSVSWAEKIETGERSLLRLPMLERVAAVLEIDVDALVDDTAAEQATQCLDAVEVRAVRRVLGDYDSIFTGEVPEVPDLERLGRQVDHACSAWLASRFTVVGQALPGLIRDGQRAVTAVGGDQRVEAARHLVMAYRLASSMLLKFESTEVAWLAADRAIMLASRSDDVVCLARATRSVARAMSKTGQRREAINVLVGMARRMEPELGDDPDLISLYGMLLLPAEVAAASDGDAATALDLHRQAEAVAQQLGGEFHDRVTAFGLTNVALHRMSALVRLHEGGRALRYARTIDPEALARLPRERNANYLLDVAEAHRQEAQPREATRAVLEAERVAPDEVRCRPVVRQLVGQLLDSPQTKPSTELRQLARRVGLPA